MLEQYKAQGQPNGQEAVSFPAGRLRKNAQRCHARRWYQHNPRYEIGRGRHLFPSWFSKELTFGEKISLWRGKIYCASKLRNEVFSTDLRKKVNRLDLPVYFFSGKYDYTVHRDMSKAYLGDLQALVKGFNTFANSPQCPFLKSWRKYGKFSGGCIGRNESPGWWKVINFLALMWLTSWLVGISRWTCKEVSTGSIAT